MKKKVLKKLSFGEVLSLLDIKEEDIDAKAKPTIMWVASTSPTSDELIELGNNILYLRDINPKLFKAISQTDYEDNFNDLAIELLDYALVMGVKTIVQPINHPALVHSIGVRLGVDMGNGIEKYSGITVKYAFRKRAHVKFINY